MTMIQHSSNIIVQRTLITSLATKKQEAQLPQRNSESATHVFLGSLTHREIQ